MVLDLQDFCLMATKDLSRVGKVLRDRLNTQCWFWSLIYNLDTNKHCHMSNYQN